MGFQQKLEYKSMKAHMQDDPIKVFRNEIKVDERRNKKNDSNVTIPDLTVANANRFNALRPGTTSN